MIHLQPHSVLQHASHQLGRSRPSSPLHRAQWSVLPVSAFDPPIEVLEDRLLFSAITFDAGAMSHEEACSQMFTRRADKHRDATGPPRSGAALC